MKYGNLPELRKDILIRVILNFSMMKNHLLLEWAIVGGNMKNICVSLEVMVNFHLSTSMTMECFLVHLQTSYFVMIPLHKCGRTHSVLDLHPPLEVTTALI